MGLFDKLFGKAEEKAASTTPAAVEAQGGEGVLCAPASGRVAPMEDSPDPVFSSKAMGDGCVVFPDGEVVYAPVTGTVAAAMPHAIGITGDDGTEALVHVGVDTVSMNGKGFTLHVAQGDHVAAGQPLVSFSRKAIADAGYIDCIMLIVTNTDAFASVNLVAEGNVTAGQKVVECTKA